MSINKNECTTENIVNIQVENPTPTKDNQLTETYNYCHVSSHDKESIKQLNGIVIKKLYAAIITCAIFMLIELIGGFYINSLAIISDALHVVSDLLGFVVSIFAVKLSEKRANKFYSFGYARAEILGAYLSVSFIWIVGISLSYSAIHRLIVDNEYHLNDNYMIVLAVAAVVMNLLMFILLNFSNIPSKNISSLHNHSHNIPLNSTKLSVDLNRKLSHMEEDIDKIKNEIKATKNLNIQAASIHVIGDLLQSFAVLIASFIIYHFPKLKFIDAICTLLFAFITFCTTFKFLKNITSIIMEKVPKDVDYIELRNELKSINYVKNVHNLRVWCLTPDKHSLNVHLVIDDSLYLTQVLNEAQSLIRNLYKSILYVTIQIEVSHGADCLDCKEDDEFFVTK